MTAKIRKVDLRNPDYRRCVCCQLIQHISQFWLGDQPCGACKRELCTQKICKLATLHDH
jgi:hypothetical protein